jgi:RimJ/RimL family protein N-acetyltransferase
MIELVKMTEGEFADYLKDSLPLYASEKMRAEGLTQEEANKVAEDSYQRLLPQGLHTSDHYLFTIQEKAGGRPIGVIWYNRKRSGKGDYAYIYDIILNESERGKGYGRASMELLESKVREQGMRAITLHVFGHNSTARALYEKVGYRASNIIMTKDL